MSIIERERRAAAEAALYRLRDLLRAELHQDRALGVLNSIPPKAFEGAAEQVCSELPPAPRVWEVTEERKAALDLATRLGMKEAERLYNESNGRYTERRVDILMAMLGEAQ